jgi:hypothetical protein
MIPTWMVVEKVVQEMDVLRMVGGALHGDGDVDRVLTDAAASVRSLHVGSDAEAVHQAWRAVARAQAAVRNATRVASPRRPTP